MLSPQFLTLLRLLAGVVAIFIVSQLIERLVRVYLQKVFHKSQGQKINSLVSNIIHISVWSIGILILLQILGIPITPILTTLGVGGIAIALALQETLSNIFAGIHIIINRQIKPGDFISLENGQEGCVVDINWRTTNLQTLTDNFIIVSNSILAKSVLTNHRLPTRHIGVRLVIGVSYNSDTGACGACYAAGGALGDAKS